MYEKLKQKEDPHIKSFEAMLNANTISAFGFDASTFTEQDSIMMSANPATVPAPHIDYE